VRVTQPELVASAGGGGAVEQGAGFTFSGRYTNGVYWLGIDTAKLSAGRYNVWVVYEGETAERGMESLFTHRDRAVSHEEQEGDFWLTKIAKAVCSVFLCSVGALSTLWAQTGLSASQTGSLRRSPLPENG